MEKCQENVCVDKIWWDKDNDSCAKYEKDQVIQHQITHLKTKLYYCFRLDGFLPHALKDGDIYFLNGGQRKNTEQNSMNDNESKHSTLFSSEDILSQRTHM